MKRTIGIQLDITKEQEKKLTELQEAFRAACNAIFAVCKAYK